MIADYVHPLAGRYRGFAGAFRHAPAGGAATVAPRAAPTFGEHSDQVLAELGFSTVEIERLRGTGVVA